MSAMKTFPQFTREYIRKGISYVNLMYLLQTIAPYRKYEPDDDQGTKRGKTESKKPIKQEKITHFEQFRF